MTPPLRRKLSSEPLHLLARIPIRECGEPLVNFLELCPALLLDRPRYDYRPETLLRVRVVRMLCVAAHKLEPGFRLSVVEGWRAPEHQRLQYQQTWNRFRHEHPDLDARALKRLVERYSAPADGPAPAPHVTGGAVDVWLCDADGQPRDLCSPFEPSDPASYPSKCSRLSDEARSNRRILSAALSGSGLTNYPAEYWHWSYGDQGWAYRTGSTTAIYGAISASTGGAVRAPGIMRP